MLNGLRRIPVLVAPIRSMTALTTSSPKRERFSMEPPYSSVRLLHTSWRNWSTKYPFALRRGSKTEKRRENRNHTHGFLRRRSQLSTLHSQQLGRTNQRIL